jgi:hypothetical protein
MRLDRVDLEGRKHARKGRVEGSTHDLHQAHLEKWLPEAEGVRGRIMTFFAAADLVSRRYFQGVDILYPETRENLTSNLVTITNLMDTFADLVLASERSDDQFRDHVLRLLEEQVEPKEPNSRVQVGVGDSAVSIQAKKLAEQWVLTARAETLVKMGEQEAAEGIAHRLICEYMS